MNNTQWAVMPKKHWDDILDATKAQIEDDTPLLSGQVAEKIQSITARPIPIIDGRYLFQNNVRIGEIDNYDLSEVELADYMFDGASELGDVPETFKTDKLKSATYLCSNCTRLLTVPYWELPEVESLDYAFNGCSALKSIGGIFAPKLKSMAYTFYANNNAGLKLLYFSKDTPMIVNDCENFDSAFRTAVINTGVKGSLVLESENGKTFRNTFQRSRFEYIKVCMKNATIISSAFEETYDTDTIEVEFGESITNAEKAFANTRVKNVIASGVIPISMSFSSTSSLTAESAISIINALKDYSGTDKEFTQTITFSAETKSALEALGATSPNGNTWLEYIGDKGWLYS